MYERLQKGIVIIEKTYLAGQMAGELDTLIYSILS